MASNKRTPRGFAIYGEVADDRGNVTIIQQSSAIGGPYCWIFVKDKDGKDTVMVTPPGVPMAVSPHLTKAQARHVAAALLRFANG